MNGFLAAPGPRWFTIPSHRPFLEDLAGGVWRALAGGGAQTLADATILLPTRRAARDLGEAFLRATGTDAVLLPKIRALGDLDESEAPFEPGDMALDLPPAISALRRRFELAGLIVEHQDLLERKLDAGSALELADALATFLDSCQIEETGDPAAVESLVEGELARHWLVSARFLNVALEAWPKRLEALGMVDIAARRVGLMRLLAARWRGRPPDQLIIAAGSTGSAPATADLLAAIAYAPRGCVVLPGLDKALAEKAWEQVGESHPQGSMRRLLQRAGISRGQVRDWDLTAEASSKGRWRRRLINAALRPPDATADWLEEIALIREEGAANGADPISEGLAGLTVIGARTEEEAAMAASLLLREVLETPDKTCALITPDAALARRVSARLTRWGITADSSAGQPLAAAPAAVLASLVARFVADPADPVALLAILKHPLTRLGLKKGLRKKGRALERYGLRGPRPGGWEGLDRRLQGALAKAKAGDEPSEHSIAAIEEAMELVPRLRTALALAGAAYAGNTARPGDSTKALVIALEKLALGQNGKTGALWAGPAGEQLGDLLSSLVRESAALPEVTRFAFSELLDGLIAREVVRSGDTGHPRLRILGVLEGRLMSADRLVMAGLEEGVWPQGASIDPFLSRPMRERLGLPPPERRIGLSAHDFAQAACAPEVVLLHCERAGGSPAVQARWLWRLETLVKGAGRDLPGRPEVIDWARVLDAPLRCPPEFLKTASRPRPTPPVKARPRQLAVTEIERWVRDPYGLYAQKILQLRPLDRPDEPVEALARGSAVHKAFERFASEHPDELPQEAESIFALLLQEALREAGMPEARMAREQILAANAAPWVIALERRRRPGARLLIEQKGELTFETAAGPFTLTAKADRIEARAGLADVLDVKTGAPPSEKMVRAGLSPQLTLTGAILAGGGFTELGAMSPGDLLYVRVSGGRIPGEEESRGGGDAPGLAADALAGLKRRVAAFDNPATPYVSWAKPQFIGIQGGEYDHVSRLWEWHVVGEAEE